MLIVLAAIVGAQTHSAHQHFYLCNYGRAPGGVTVHAAPSGHSKSVAHLRAGAAVYICDERGGWYKVHFNTLKRRCPTAPTGLDVRGASACPSGWVRGHSVTVLSG